MTKILKFFKKPTISKKIERVRQSQLGVFIENATNGNPLKVKSLTKLAKLISSENSVDCRVEDLEKFYNLEEATIDEDCELGLRIVEYAI